MGESSFIAAHCVGGNAGLRKKRGREVMARCGGRASVLSRDAERNEGNNCRGWRGGDVEGSFVRTSVARR
jgi:hypothetical protein